MSSSWYEPYCLIMKNRFPCPVLSVLIREHESQNTYKLSRVINYWSWLKFGLKLGYCHSKCWVSNCGTERITRVHCKVVGQRDAQFIAGALVPQYNISFDQSTPAAPLLEFVQNMLKGPRNYFTSSVNSKTKTDKVKRTHNLWPYQVGRTELPASLSGRSHPQTLIPTHQQTIIPRARKS